ncbi:hypothetical protein [Desulfobacula sp.]
MKISTKAVLFSAFVLPGAGHIYLKKYLTGVLLIGASLAGFYYLISKVVETALEIVESMQLGHVQLDVTAINQLLSNHSTGTEYQPISIAIIIFWIIGMIDSYRIGRLQDKT